MHSRPFNCAVVGYGLSAKIFHIPMIAALPDDFTLYAIVQRSPSAANNAAQDHPGIKLYHALDDACADPAVDLVVLCTVPETHLALATAALQARKHVLVEKPFLPSSADAAQLLDVERASGRRVAVYQNRRWDADFLTLRRILADGALGDVVELATHFDRHRPAAPPRDSWKARAGPGHGALFDLGAHLVDQVYALFGRPESVYASVGHQRPSAGDGDPPDSFTLLLGYDGGRAMVTAKAGVVSPEAEQLRFWVRGTQGSYRKCHLDVQEDQLKAGMRPGDAGFGVEPEAHWGALTRVREDGGLARAPYPTLAPETYVEFYRRLARALRGEGEVPVSAEEGKDVLEILEAAMKSAELGMKLDASDGEESDEGEGLDMDVDTDV